MGSTSTDHDRPNSPNPGDVKVGGSKDAARFREIMSRRFSDRRAVADHGWYSTVITIGVSDGVRLTDMGENYRLFVYLNPEAPSCALKLINGALYFDAEDGRLTWQELMDLADTLPVALPRNTPYFYVVNEEVHGIVFVGDGGWMTDESGVPYGNGAQDIALHCFVLDGEPRPDFFRFNGDIYAFMAAMWRAVDRRYLRPAGNRLLRLAAHLTYAVNDGVATVEYASVDDAQPAIAVRRPYVLWGSAESVPGEHMPESGPYSITLLEVLTGRRPGR